MRITLVHLLAVATVLLTACGLQTSPDSVDASGQVIGTGKTASYDFTGTTLDGEPFDGTALEGKPAVVWFWAPWCPTCRAQSFNLSELAEQYDGEVAVVGVGALDDGDTISEAAEQIPHVTHLVDQDGDVWKHFRVTAQSTYTVIGADGEIKSEGYLDDGELNALVEQLVS